MHTQELYASYLYYYTPKNDIRLYAKWGKKVTVTYDANGGQFYSTGSRLSTDVEKGSISTGRMQSSIRLR